MRDNDEYIRHTNKDEDYVDTDQHEENIEDYEPAQYLLNNVKNEITDDEEGQISDEIQPEYEESRDELEYDNNEEHEIIFDYDNPETPKEEKEKRISVRTRNKSEMLDPTWHGK